MTTQQIDIGQFFTELHQQTRQRGGYPALHSIEQAARYVADLQDCLSTVMPYALSRAEDMQDEAYGLHKESEAYREAKELADKASSAVTKAYELMGVEL